MIMMGGIDFAGQIRLLHAGSYPYWVTIRFKAVYVTETIFSNNTSFVLCMN